MPALRSPYGALLILAMSLPAAERPHTPDEGMLADGWVTDLQLQSGIRTLDNDGWSGLDTQWAVGLDFLTEPPRWPIGIVLGVISNYSSYEDGNDFEWSLGVVDWYVGVRRTERLGLLDFHYGGGFVGSYISLKGGPNGVIHDSDGTAGAYGEVGLQACFNGMWTIGARARYTVSSDFSFVLADEDGDVDGMTLLGTIGLRF